MPVDEARVASLSSALHVRPSLARLLVSRGVHELADATAFLDPRLSNLSDPYLLPGMREAATRIWAAVLERRPVLVFGDYDVDGVTATALLVSVLRELGGEVSHFLPDRLRDGYGFTLGAVERCLEAGRPSLIITVDCGTSSVEAVGFAAGQGIDVIVTDHHEMNPDTGVAPASVVLNPKLTDVLDSHGLSGVGVAFKLCHALVKHGMAEGRPEVKGLDLRDYLEFVALGTVADVVPLRGENRILVRHGLARLNRTANPGLLALMKVAGVKEAADSFHVGFMLGPRLNAAGRLGPADPALELLMTRDEARAFDLADELDRMNRQRKSIEETIRVAATGEIDEAFDPSCHFGLVVGRAGWHVGTVGIVAARLCSLYNRPAVVVGFDDQGIGRGSCRSIEGVSMVEVLQECGDLLTSYGGHEMAAGVSLKWENLADFRERFNAVCDARMSGRDLRPVIRVDGWVGLGQVDDDLFESIARLRPLGEANPVPIWGVRGVRVVGEPRVVGTAHLRMTLASGGSQIDAIAFRMAHRPVPEGSLDVLFHLQENIFRGRRTLELNVKDFRANVPS